MNGTHIVLPWGMGQDAFLTKLREAWPSLMTTYGLPTTTPSARVRLNSIGDSRYLVTVGDAPLYGTDGRMVMFEVAP